MTLAEFKRSADGSRLTLTKAEQLAGGEWLPMPHKFLKVARSVRVRAADMVLTDADGNESYMQFGKAALWTFDGNRATFEEIERNEGYGATEYGTRLVYEVTE